MVAFLQVASTATRTVSGADAQLRAVRGELRGTGYTPGSVVWRDEDTECLRGWLATVRVVDVRSTKLDMRQPSYKPSPAACRRRQPPQVVRGAGTGRDAVAAPADAVVVPHDRVLGDGPPSEAMQQRALVDDGRYLVRWEERRAPRRSASAAKRVVARRSGERGRLKVPKGRARSHDGGLISSPTLHGVPTLPSLSTC